MATIDVKPSWTGFVTCLQAEAAKYDAPTVITVHLVTDPQGNMLFWTKPVTVRIEPERRQQLVAAFFAGAIDEVKNS